jgi:hypothetical protein
MQQEEQVDILALEFYQEKGEHSFFLLEQNFNNFHLVLVNKKAISIIMRLLFLFLYYGYTTNLSLPFFNYCRGFFGKEILLEKTPKEIKTLR